MDISLRWLNRCLSAPVSGDEAEHLLTFAGFPFDGREIVALPSGESDECFDVEVTSNRGDVLSHVGCAREIAAASEGRELVMPEMPAIRRGGGRIEEALTLENTTPEVCPLFTAHVIRGVKVGPSPAWLVDLLESVGQRSINNVVDVTNLITLELGNPCHVFDLKKLAGATLRIRYASEGEKLTTLDGKERVLKATDLVVADAERAQSLAGVIGGQDSEVDETTVDVVFEMATWDPVTIRRPARRMSIRTDAGYRFERIVDARSIAEAAERAVGLIQDLAGGDVLEGVFEAGRGGECVGGRDLPVPEPIVLRTGRCCSILGVELGRDEIAGLLTRLGVGCEAVGDDLRCVPPVFRPDLEREIDLIEEVARVHGYENVPLLEKLPIRVRHPQETERNRAKVASVLTGLGFFETVTFSFMSPKAAEPYVLSGQATVSVDDDRRGAEPTLRPSVIPSLLACRAANQAARVQQDGGIRLYEISAVFSEIPKSDGPGQSVEHLALTLLMDVEGVKSGKKAKPEQLQVGVRAMRGAIEGVIREVGRREIRVVPTEPMHSGFDPSACGDVLVDGQRLGSLGLVHPDRLAEASLDVPMVAAELDWRPIIEMEAARGHVSLLPGFPGIERDLSFVVNESVRWDAIGDVVNGLAGELDHYEGAAFVGVFRGEQIGAGKKSATMRLRFRAPDRTLTHDEVDPQIERVVASVCDTIGADLRA